MSEINYSELKLWEKHEGDLNFNLNQLNKPEFVEEGDLDYLFYFETDSYSEFIIGEQKIPIIPPSPPSSGGGGSSGGGSSSSKEGGSIRGGGATARNIFMDESQLRERQTISLSKGEKMNFRLSNQNNHTLTVNNFNNESVNLTIASEPINLTLFLGEEVKLNLTSPDYYDLYLKLENITYNKINLTLQEINESIIPKIEEEIEEVDLKKNKKIENLIIGIICFLGILVLIYFCYKSFKKNKTKTKEKKKKKSKKMKKVKKPH